MSDSYVDAVINLRVFEGRMLVGDIEACEILHPSASEAETCLASAAARRRADIALVLSWPHLELISVRCHVWRRSRPGD